MTRLRHWRFNFATAVSLMLCLATAALCVRGLSYNDQWYYLAYDPASGTTSI